MKYLLFLFCFTMYTAFPTYANIGVSPMVIDLVNTQANAEIAVKNFDNKHNAYVEITAYYLSNPADPKASKKRVRHPDKDGLLVFPAKLILLPGQTQYVKVVKSEQTLSTDRVYEVDFIPKVVSKIASHKSPEGPTLGIRVVVGYGARVILRPDKPSPLVSIKRIENQLVIKNKGNTSLTITSCHQSISGKKTEISLPAYTLFAGQLMEKKLTQAIPVTMDVSFMGKMLGSFNTD